MTDYKHEVRDYNDGQIYGWNGGECPVHPETVVKFWMRDGYSVPEGIGRSLRWSALGASSDIIAFQVVKAYVEPKVIWVNEYADGTCWAGCDEETAKMCAAKDATRIAVKYVEVVDDKEVKDD
jgi:hypothetical protein